VDNQAPLERRRRGAEKRAAASFINQAVRRKRCQRSLWILSALRTGGFRSESSAGADNRERRCARGFLRPRTAETTPVTPVVVLGPLPRPACSAQRGCDRGGVQQPARWIDRADDTDQSRGQARVVDGRGRGRHRPSLRRPRPWQASTIASTAPSTCSPRHAGGSKRPAASRARSGWATGAPPRSVRWVGSRRRCRRSHAPWTKRPGTGWRSLKPTPGPSRPS
jgi:hypothetical protein